MNDIQAGRQAERMLDDEVFQRAVQRADENYVQEWRESATVDERERAYMKQKVLHDVVKELRGIVNRGTYAEHEKEKEENRS